jgi:hypothetical protein
VNVAKNPPQVVAGNGTLAAVLAMGLSHIAVSAVEWDDATAAAYAVADNKTALDSEWDDAALRETLAQIETGLDPQLDAMMKELQAELDRKPFVPNTTPAIDTAQTTAGDVAAAGEAIAPAREAPKLAAVVCPHCAGEFNVDPEELKRCLAAGSSS